MMFTASVGAFGPSLTLGTYSISKMALISLVRNLAAELGPQGIRANAICPGLIRTDFAQALWDNPAGEKRAREQIPLRRLGEAEDLKGLAVFLASGASGYITGQAITIEQPEQEPEPVFFEPGVPILTAIDTEWHTPGRGYFTVPAGTPVRLAPREHRAWRWLPWQAAAEACFSPSNAEAILHLPRWR